MLHIVSRSGPSVVVTENGALCFPLFSPGFGAVQTTSNLHRAYYHVLASDLQYTESDKHNNIYATRRQIAALARNNQRDFYA
jgi:hypothetical protein